MKTPGRWLWLAHTYIGSWRDLYSFGIKHKGRCVLDGLLGEFSLSTCKMFVALGDGLRLNGYTSCFNEHGMRGKGTNLIYLAHDLREENMSNTNITTKPLFSLFADHRCTLAMPGMLAVQSRINPVS